MNRDTIVFPRLSSDTYAVLSSRKVNMGEILKIRTDLTLNQKKALECMSGIARLRDEMPYMRKLKKGGKGKKIFAEFTEGFVCDAFNLKRCERINQKGYDAIYNEDIKIQIKDVTYSAPFFGIELEFDFLITVSLNKSDFSIQEICVYPKTIIEEHLNRENQFRDVSKFPEYIYYKNGKWIKDEIQFENKRS